jgi:hypothetical protein
VRKEVTPATTIEPVVVDGHPGFWITGAPHTFGYFDAGGNALFEPTRLVTGNTLLWIERGTTYRLESALDLADALALAGEMAPLR